jgi:hypothetical protein
MPCVYAMRLTAGAADARKRARLTPDVSWQAKVSRAGRRAADDHGKTLPRYGSWEEAERALYAQRDPLLGQLRTAAAASPSFHFDFTPESLKTLER